MARKILIADDSPTVQKKASGILVGEGMEVVTVSNGVAAIKKLPTVNPMVILADVAMPGKDGYEVCEFVKGSKEYGNVPVLLVFSDGDMYDEQRGARVHADGRIKKPFDRDELIATVAKHLAAAEAAATKAQAAPVFKASPPPPPTFVTEPVDAEPEISTKKESPDVSSIEGGFAFAEPALEEIPAAPAEPAPAFEYAATSEPGPVMESEPPVIVAPMIEPEVSGGGEPQIETTPEMPAPSPMEPPPPAEPVFIEEHAAPEHTHEHEHEHPHVTERTMMFRAPAEIAEPILSDELVLPPAVEPPPVEPPPVEALSEVAAMEAAPVEASAVEVPEPAPEPAAEASPVAATTLDSYSLSEAAAGHVHVGHEESSLKPTAPPVAEPPAVAVAQAPPTLDSAQVYSIVYMVVAKMSPRLPPQAIEGIAKPIADEINAELSAGHTKNS